ncbi:hypothetical protein LO762_31030 [Actinocorallia sp. API 0066]|uniref:hypothetical protein n=1 Tax=Actinocorallia sp. API 0066 TaxID=2896846 RepID=UPI001E2BCE87|nr:hypothetical protein [Actinocorallia sp. API 0066]MCD0453585.1 hypothetical protein [Actinocorallia sp. API 0066]
MPQRRMSSRAVKIGLLGTLSMSLTACGSSHTATCVENRPLSNGSYRVVSDYNCNDSYSSNYRWYYGGSSGGATVKGGSTLKPKNGSIKTKSGTTLRGGFGWSGGGGG